MILEARHRIGGRIWTDASLGVPIDFGAAAVHGRDGNPLPPLLAAAGLAVREVRYDSLHCRLPGGAVVDPALVDDAGERFEELFDRLTEDARAGESVSDALARLAPGALADPLMALYAGVEIEFDVGSSLDRIAAGEIGELKTFDGPDLFPVQGFGRLADFLARGLDIRTGHPVCLVRATSSGVVLSGEWGEIACDFCICTLPIGVLKSGDVRFEPGLPAALTGAIDRLGAGAVVKVALRFDRPFWPKDVQYLGYLSGAPSRFPTSLCIDAIHPGSNILMAFALGRWADHLADLPDEAAVADALSMLTDMYGAAVGTPSGSRVQRWAREAYSRCAYSFASTATRRSDFSEFEAVVNGRIAFAGEHTIAARRGTVHGALLSGERAARTFASPPFV